jgi:high-affinity Fe2+/Pb2+ permease
MKSALARALVGAIVAITIAFILAIAVVWTGVDQKGQAPPSTQSERPP